MVDAARRALFADAGEAVMKLHEQLSWQSVLGAQAIENLVLRAFDINFQNVDVSVLEFFHHRANRICRCIDKISTIARVTLGRPHHFRRPAAFADAPKQPQAAVFPGSRPRMEYEVGRQLQGRNPLF